MRVALCCQCDLTMPVTVHGFCLVCGSGSVLYRRASVLPSYSPDEQTRLSLNCETTPDDLVTKG